MFQKQRNLDLPSLKVQERQIHKAKVAYNNVRKNNDQESHDK
jgi:hypothetical protein